jgi:alpha-glucosidase
MSMGYGSHENNHSRNASKGVITMAVLPEGAVVYQVYPRSLQDSDGDGIGDLPGIESRMPYLAALGVDFVWFSPTYPSPMADFGYDISDYMGVHPMFGTIRDFKRLVKVAGKNGIGVIIDVVFNHTSKMHPWFQKSRSSMKNSKRNWYIWADPGPDGSPPNNWDSVFGGSAWTLDEKTGQYYLHSFLPDQPDLNLENPEVQEALREVLRFWFRIGVVGVRVDAVDWMAKDVWNFENDPDNPDFDSDNDRDLYHRLRHEYSAGMPHVKRYLDVFTEAALEFPGRFVVVETYLRGFKAPEVEYRQMLNMYTPGVSAPFVFGLMSPGMLTAANASRFINMIQGLLRPGEIPIYVFGNHDSVRMLDRYGPAGVRLATLMQHTLPGIVIIYAGDELGLGGGVLRRHQIRDPAALQDPTLGRDPERRPIRWTDDPKGGFTTGTPWLPIAPGRGKSAQVQARDPRSMLALTQNLIRIRREERSLGFGTFVELDLGQEDVFAYVRTDGTESHLVLFNFRKVAVTVNTPYSDGQLVLSTRLDRPSERINVGRIRLRAREGLLVRLHENVQQ